MNKVVKLNKDKLKNSNEIRLYKARIVQALNRDDKNQGDKENKFTWLIIKKSVTKKAENLRMQTMGRKKV